ncbi:MAG: hypothetical protein BM557_02025 [Flavobacterium sp. MedPE-SWcel]|uniref:hypothetical protein n=1 Tax=uncultured Flavobacterium sp. TaxID=165435 RepID=UPI0009245595|nr:hypothetical protein [uncultured Flavobacterium sp.]OIQ22175.1 MAG: hypothetical protein BM557_02025 [Flavobacterium sp. MedPE-SWcel]
MNKPTKTFIGIDPDVDKSGVAFLSGNNLRLQNLKFFELFDYFKTLKKKGYNPVIYVECGFLNKSNWHKSTGKSAAFNAKIGERTGANFETAKKIVEMCEYLKLEHYKIKPTRKKINNDFFKNLTGLKIRTNQEQRDAYMLIHGR